MTDKKLKNEAHNYAVNWEEINNELDWCDLTSIEVSEIDFIAGAEYQAKRMYSEEEVYQILVNHTLYNSGFGERTSLSKWFSKYKKK